MIHCPGAHVTRRDIVRRFKQYNQHVACPNGEYALGVQDVVTLPGKEAGG
jgi:hypothetical protein